MNTDIPVIREDLLRELEVALRTLQKSGDYFERGFNMETWARGKLPENPTLGCGTVCCAYGVGTTLPGWQAAGLTLVHDEAFGGYTPATQDHSDPWSSLGLTYGEWRKIFAPTNSGGLGGKVDKNTTPGQVADAIDRVIKRRQASEAKS